MNRASVQLLRASLVVVWLATAVVSVWELHGQSRELLAGLPTAWAGGHAPWLPTAIILAGAAADAVLGLWLALRPGRKAYGAALMVMLAMTLLATAIHPAWWLHPFGPLTKNLPIAAILWVLLQDEATSLQKP
ncbi:MULTISPECIES: DoxX-like family protein [unclassified Acidovorax]|uniref:DoxX-like family protein n=1 Tax=unclassified Acidovorax TaxID=2684926 RepID=UPI0006FB09B5|nr:MULTISPECIES: DoxX-like family protein [unclassified Acidovorax]KQW21723.1 epimerase [Acidovorax sp. Root402]PIF18967.1 DoxX-like protein [Acidovorax sp. 59]PKW02006.1 DoxX-like protein [Acidovorax sp. 30]